MAAAESAHLTGNAFTIRPSVFELLSHEGFANALKPAASHVIKVLAEQDPSGRFGLAYRYFDELYLTFDAVVQWHYVLTRGATLSEAFYGLERKLTDSEHKLSRIRISYMVSVFLPYVCSKLENFYESKTQNYTVVERPNESTNQYGGRSWSVMFFEKTSVLYPHIKTVCRVTNMCYLLSYAFGYTEHHSLVFKMLKMSLGYVSEERSKFLEAMNAELWTSSEWKNPRKVPKLIFRSLGESILFIVEIGTFFIQFLEWWYNDDRRARITLSTKSRPLPPRRLNDKKKVQTILTLQPTDMGKCPLCRKTFKNPTAISISGVVYCYGCILQHLTTENTCPLTQVVCSRNHLVRIYQ